MIERRIFSKLNDLLGRFPAVVLLGARQVGKTTLARKCAAQRDGIYLDLESQRDLSKLSDPEDYLSHREDRLVSRKILFVGYEFFKLYFFEGMYNQ